MIVKGLCYKSKSKQEKIEIQAFCPYNQSAFPLLLFLSLCITVT